MIPTTARLAVLALLAFGLTPQAAAASAVAERIDGRVVRAGSDAPIAGAIVSIAGLPGSARTDANGAFSWTPAPAPPFQIVVVLPSGQVARPVLFTERPEGLFIVPVTALGQESLTVLGAAPSVDVAPASGTTLLSASQVANRNPENLMQALETVPGINQVSEGHAAVPAVRGLARGRTLFLLDGGRVSAERRVGPGATFIDPAVIGSIDVARGPASVAYGSDAFGGVISVRTKRPEPGAPLQAAFTGTLGAGVPEARGSIEVSKGLARGGFLVQAHIRESEDYDSPSGEVFNSGWKDRGFVATLSHEVGRGALTLTAQSDFGRDFERPRNNSRTVRFFYPYENSHRFSGSYDVSDVLGFRQMSLTAFVGTWDQRTDQDRYATATTARSVERADVAANDFHVKTTAERTFKGVRAEFGVDVNGRFGLEAKDVIQRFALTGAMLQESENVSVVSARRTDAGVFAQFERAFGESARASAGIRGDRVTTKNEGGFFGDRSTAHAAGSGFGSVTLGPFDGFSVTGQVSRGFRDPVLSDRYFRGPSGRGFITGNPNLDPERSLQFDVALRFSRGRAQTALYLYQYRIDDLVERYQTQTDFFFFRNRGRARIRGVELEARADLGGAFSIEFAAHTARGRALDPLPGESGDLDDAPQDAVMLLLRREMGARGWAQARAALYGGDDRPGPTEIATPGYAVVDLSGGVRIGRRLEVRGLIRNALDEEYPASPDARFVPAPGRSASVTLVARF